MFLTYLSETRQTRLLAEVITTNIEIWHNPIPQLSVLTVLNDLNSFWAICLQNSDKYAPDALKRWRMKHRLNSDNNKSGWKEPVQIQLVPNERHAN